MAAKQNPNGSRWSAGQRSAIRDRGLEIKDPRSIQLRQTQESGSSNRRPLFAISCLWSLTDLGPLISISDRWSLTADQLISDHWSADL